jgi:hypothetical protein
VGVVVPPYIEQEEQEGVEGLGVRTNYLGLLGQDQGMGVVIR